MPYLYSSLYIISVDLRNGIKLCIFVLQTVKKEKLCSFSNPDSVFNHFSHCGLISFSDYMFLLTILCSKLNMFLYSVLIISVLHCLVVTNATFSFHQLLWVTLKLLSKCLI